MGDRVDRPLRGNLTRPTVREIYNYRSAIDEEMIALFKKMFENKWKKFADLLELGLNHEQQHQELFLMDIKFILGMNPLHPSYLEKNNPAQPSSILEKKLLQITCGVHEIGYDGDGFCYDNEQPGHGVFVEDFEVEDRSITNEELLYRYSLESRKDLKDGLKHCRHRELLTPGLPFFKQFHKIISLI